MGGPEFDNKFTALVFHEPAEATLSTRSLHSGRKRGNILVFGKPGQVISIKESSRDIDKIKANIENNASRTPPKWLDYDATNIIAKVVAVPDRDDIDLPIEEQLIVELYSK